jgi:hypothetical protein
VLNESVFWLGYSDSHEFDEKSKKKKDKIEKECSILMPEQCKALDR